MATTEYQEQPVHGRGWSAAAAPDGTTAVFAAACDIATRLPTTAFHCDCGDLRDDAPCEHFYYYFPDAGPTHTAHAFPDAAATGALAQSGDRNDFLGSGWGYIARIFAFTIIALSMIRACGVL